MQSALIALLSVLTFSVAGARGVEQTDSTPPVVVRILAQAPALGLSDAQVHALELVRDRRDRTLAALTERLRVAETQATVAAADDTLTLMQEIGRLQVLSGREALQRLTPSQRRRWVALQAGQTP